MTTVRLVEIPAVATATRRSNREETAIMSDSAPVLGAISKQNGVAGQVSYSVTVVYPGESPSVATFVGSVYGGPVVMVMPSGVQTFVTDPDRHGAFGPEWVRRFFS